MSCLKSSLFTIVFHHSIYKQKIFNVWCSCIAIEAFSFRPFQFSVLVFHFSFPFPLFPNTHAVTKPQSVNCILCGYVINSSDHGPLSKQLRHTFLRILQWNKTTLRNDSNHLGSTSVVIMSFLQIVYFTE